ncbi:hypothetical protein MNB_SUP05-SYMBIONT-5-517 [hydrothermal vent metagenome]
MNFWAKKRLPYVFHKLCWGFTHKKTTLKGGFFTILSN